jgi:phosphoenolpyruvate phosphomutase
MAAEGDVVLAVDRSAGGSDIGVRDLVEADSAPGLDFLDEAAPRLRRIAADVAPAVRAGEWIGLARFSALGTSWLVEEIGRLREEGLLEQADMPMLLTRLAARHEVALHLTS